jgi:hypothetical protein
MAGFYEPANGQKSMSMTQLRSAEIVNSSPYCVCTTLFNCEVADRQELHLLHWVSAEIDEITAAKVNVYRMLRGRSMEAGLSQRDGKKK